MFAAAIHSVSGRRTTSPASKRVVEPLGKKTIEYMASSGLPSLEADEPRKPTFSEVSYECSKASPISSTASGYTARCVTHPHCPVRRS